MTRLFIFRIIFWGACFVLGYAVTRTLTGAGAAP